MTHGAASITYYSRMCTFSKITLVELEYLEMWQHSVCDCQQKEHHYI